MESSTAKRPSDTARTEQLRRARLRLSLELAGEIVLLALVGAFFVYMFIESLDWPLGSALMPWIAIGIGVPFWLYRLIVVIFQTKEAATGQIMDIGFRTGDDPSGERNRFLRICGFIVGLYLAIWLFGFHIALPLGILFYVRAYGGLSWIGSIVLALLFVALLVGVYDRLLNATWHEPPVLQWILSFFPQAEG